MTRSALQRQRRARARQRARGECDRCPAPAVPDRPLCAEHLAARRTEETVRRARAAGESFPRLREPLWVVALRERGQPHEPDPLGGWRRSR